MSRRNKPEQREILPDVRYNSVQVQIFINHVMSNGKKSVATRLVYDALDLVEERTKRTGLEVFEQAIKNVGAGDGSQAPPCRWRNLPGADGSPPVSPLCSGHPLDLAALPAPALARAFPKNWLAS